MIEPGTLDHAALPSHVTQNAQGEISSGTDNRQRLNVPILKGGQLAWLFFQAFGKKSPRVSPVVF